MNRLISHYNTSVKADLINKFNYTNVSQIPKLLKIVVHLTTKDTLKNPKNVVFPLLLLELVTGQKPEIIKAKHSIATFKLQKGNLMGGRVTLRGPAMYTFLDKLITISLPKVREFNGLSDKKFDNVGNYSFGINDISIFPEIEASYNNFTSKFGLDINIITSNKNKNESKALLSAFHFPFKTN